MDPSSFGGSGGFTAAWLLQRCYVKSKLESYPKAWEFITDWITKALLSDSMLKVNYFGNLSPIWLLSNCSRVFIKLLYLSSSFLLLLSYRHKNVIELVCQNFFWVLLMQLYWMFQGMKLRADPIYFHYCSLSKLQKSLYSLWFSFRNKGLVHKDQYARILVQHVLYPPNWSSVTYGLLLIVINCSTEGRTQSKDQERILGAIWNYRLQSIVGRYKEVWCASGVNWCTFYLSYFPLLWECVKGPCPFYMACSMYMVVTLFYSSRKEENQNLLITILVLQASHLFFHSFNLILSDFVQLYNMEKHEIFNYLYFASFY